MNKPGRLRALTKPGRLCTRKASKLVSNQSRDCTRTVTNPLLLTQPRRLLRGRCLSLRNRLIKPDPVLYCTVLYLTWFLVLPRRWRKAELCDPQHGRAAPVDQMAPSTGHVSCHAQWGTLDLLEVLPNHCCPCHARDVCPCN